MPGRIFINYRRDDDPGSTGRLFDRLEAHFEPEQLFLDVDSIAPGLDFVRVLDAKVSECDVFLAVIGRDWLRAADESGARRLDRPDDFVRIEIESALRRGVRVIPVLINRAEMPAEDQLPDSLKPFARRNAVRLNHDRFKTDCEGLIKAVERALQLAEAAHKAKAETESSLRGQLSAGDVAKADELANWSAIKNSRKAQDFVDHLARFPKGTTQRMARARLEAVQWMAGFGPEVVALVVLPMQFLLVILSQSRGMAVKFLPTLFANDAASGVASGIVIVVIGLLVLAYRRRTKRHRIDIINYWLALVFAATPLIAFIVPAKILLTSAITLSAVVGSGALLLFRRIERASGAELGSYWLGCTFAVLICVPAVFNDLEWPSPRIGLELGFAIAFGITFGSAVLLARARWPIGGVELSTYWLGSLLAATPFLGILAQTNEWTLPLPFIKSWSDEDTNFGAGTLIALVLGLAAAFLLVHPRRMTVSGAELRRYWVGCTLVGMLSFSMLLIGAGFELYTGMLIALGAAVAAGAGLIFWWRTYRKDDRIMAASR